MGKLGKSGEGSRGGHVIGHTANGSAIYSSNHQNYHEVHKIADEGHSTADESAHMSHALRRAYKGMSAQDHMHASELHTRAAGTEGTARHEGHRAAMAHAEAAMHLMHRRSQASRSMSPSKSMPKGDMRKSDLEGPIPTYDPGRDPNGTDVSKLREARNGPLCVDDGLNDLIIATIKSQADIVKPDPRDYRKAEPVYTAGRVNG